MFNYWKRNKSFAIFKGFLSAALLIATTAQAMTYPANSTSNCTGPKNCTLESWGIDLNDNTGYSWQVSSAQASAANIYIKVASLSGTRSMSLWVNNTKVATLSTNSTTAPRPTGAELSAVPVQLVSGTNSIELRDTENTTEFDVHYLRVETASTSSNSSSSSSTSSTSATLSLNITNNSGLAYINETVNLSAAISAGSGWQYQWKLIEDETYKRTDIHDLTWSSNWDSRCQPANIGQRVTAKLYPPVTGQYKFAVAADDMHELYITHNGSKQLITSSSVAVDAANYNNQSQLISLNANTAYPFEFLYINNSGSGHFSILWQKPGSNQWEELPEDVFSKVGQSAPSGRLLQETFHQNLGSMSQLKGLSSFTNSRSNSGNAVTSGQNITFTPSGHKTYTFEVTATSGSQTITNYISFFAEGRFISEDHTSASTVWKKYNGYSLTPNQTGMSITTAGDNTATGNVLQIETSPSNEAPLRWQQDIYLEPYAAYEIRGRVRLLNAPGNIKIPESNGDRDKWLLPRVRVGVHGDASEQGIDAINPSQWQEIAVDFVVPFNGYVDLHAHMGYSGTYQVDNLHLVKLTGRGATSTQFTQFKFDNLVANIPGTFVTKAGGYEAAKGYIQRLSNSAEKMRQLSGQNYIAQCRKESVFVPLRWEVFAYGTYTNDIVLKTKNVLDDAFLQNVWGSSNIVGGVMIHELEHGFDHDNLNFGIHMTNLLQTYAMETTNLLRTHNGAYLTAQQWMQYEINTLDICSSPEVLFTKLVEFQDLLQDRWQPFKQIMHDQLSPYKKTIEQREWPHTSNYEKYLHWWDQLESYTGIDGWNLLHTQEEKTIISRMFDRQQNPVIANENASIYDYTKDTLYLHKVGPISSTVGYDKLDVNEIIWKGNQCNYHNIYAHAPSSISYNLGKQWLAFNTKAAIKNGSVAGQVVARISGDGNTLYESSSFTAQNSPIDPGTIDVSNVDQLTIEFLDGGNNNSDWSVWLNPELTRYSTAGPKFSNNAKVIKHSSGKCIAPESGSNPAMNEKAVLSNDCSSSNVKYKWLASGAIMHVNSGACLHPYEGSSNPANGTYWVFFPSCEYDSRIQYKHTNQNRIEHRSGGSCIQPEGGSGTPAAATPVVFNNSCSGTPFGFTLE